MACNIANSKESAVAAAVLPAQKKYYKVKHFTTGSILADTACGVACGLAIAPIVSIIDKTIIEKTKGNIPSIRSGLFDGFKTLLTNPSRFLVRQAVNDWAVPFRLVAMVYAGTYIAANNMHSYCESVGMDEKLPKFIASSVVNVGLTLVKDVILLRVLEKSASPKKVPFISQALFIARDSITVAAAFSLPPILRDFLVSRYNFSFKAATDASIVACPVSVQALSAPLHLIGINKQNEPHKGMFASLKTVAPSYPGATGARMMRIFPAYGVGGMVNVRIRDSAQRFVANDYE
jgi:hypothetical protein